MGACVLLGAAAVFGQATTEPVAAPATAPTTQPAMSPEDAEKTLNELLRTKPGMARPIQPSPEEASARDKGTDEGIAPGEPAVPLKHEGDTISQRIVRLQKTQKGDWELRFESDGRAMQDPPVIALECRSLMRMQDQQKTAGRSLRFVVTGVLTEYRGRNYLLIEKAQVVPDEDQK
jgi:hypothetical protein